MAQAGQEPITIIPFPTMRKRSYPRRYIKSADLPANCVRLCQPAKTIPMERSATTFLVLAMIQDMDPPTRYRISTIAREGLARYPDDPDIVAALDLLVRLPCRTQGKS